MATRPWISPSLVEATQVLTFTGNALDTETVSIGHLIGNKSFLFQAALTNIDGNVLLAGSIDENITNLTNAINGTGGTIGTDYAAATIPHLYVTAVADTAADTITVTARIGGSTFNTFPTLETLTNGSWSGATLGSGVGIVGVGGDWGVAANWTGGAVPITGDDVEFGLNSVASVTGGFSQAAVNLNSMFVNEDYGGPPRQENLGNIGRKRKLVEFTATSSTGTSVTDSTNGFQAGRFIFFLITQTSGAGKGQFRSIISNTSTTVNITVAWDQNPSVGDTFIIEEFARLSIDCTKLVYGGTCEMFRVLSGTSVPGAIDELIIHNTSASTTQTTTVGGFIDSIVHTDGSFTVDNLSTVPDITIIKSAGNPKCIINPDNTLTNVSNFGGIVESQSSITTFRQSTGTGTMVEYIAGISSPTVGTLDLVGTGTVNYNSTGTLTKANLSGKLDLSENLGPITVTDVDLFEDGQYNRANGLNNITNSSPIKYLGATGVAKVTITPGTEIDII